MSDPTQIQLQNTVYAELSVFASVTFIFETETKDLPEVSDSEEPGIITTSADLAEKTEEVIQTIVTESQKAPRTTGSLDTTVDIIFTGIVVVAEITEEIIETTKITTKGDISAIGSWGKSFNLDLIGAINDKFYMGVPVSGVLSSTLNIPDLKFYIDTCKYSCGDKEGVNLIEGSCYSSVLGVKNINPNGTKIVDDVSQFRFKSFSFTETAESTSCTIICSVNTCLSNNCNPPACEGGLLGYE